MWNAAIDFLPEFYFLFDLIGEGYVVKVYFLAGLRFLESGLGYLVLEGIYSLYFGLQNNADLASMLKTFGTTDFLTKDGS